MRKGQLSITRSDQTSPIILSHSDSTHHQSSAYSLYQSIRYALLEYMLLNTFFWTLNIRDLCSDALCDPHVRFDYWTPWNVDANASWLWIRQALVNQEGNNQSSEWYAAEPSLKINICQCLNNTRLPTKFDASVAHLWPTEEIVKEGSTRERSERRLFHSIQFWSSLMLALWASLSM